MAFSFRAPDGKRTFTAIGHTVQAGASPIAAAWSYFGEAISGYLAEEKYTSAMETCLVTMVNRTDYEKAFALTKSPLERIGPSNVAVLQAYRLGENDGLSFMLSRGYTPEPSEFLNSVF